MSKMYAAGRLDVEDGGCIEVGADWGMCEACGEGASTGHAAAQPDCSGGTVYGYARVSSHDQNLDRQLDALAAFGVEPAHVYTDKASGKDFQRPAYRALMHTLGAGDVLVVKSIDRLGRNYQEILNEWRYITSVCGSAIVVLDMPLLDTRQTRENITSVLIADIVLQLLSYVAQVERESIRQRQAEGIAAAQARGVRFGRPRKERPRGYIKVRRAYATGAMTRREAAARLGVCVSTFARWIKEDDLASRVEQI